MKKETKGKILAVLISIPIFIISGAVSTAVGYRLLDLIAGERNTNISVVQRDISSKESIEAVYVPAFLPDGFVLYDRSVNEDQVISLFTNEETNESIHLQQYLSSTNHSFDNEDIQHADNIMIHGKDALYLSTHEGGNLFYYHDGYLFVIYTSNTQQITKENTIKLAESLTETNGGSDE